MFQTAYLDGKEILLIAIYGDEAWIEDNCKRRMVPLNTIKYDKE